jgi:hypothetical protein
MDSLGRANVNIGTAKGVSAWGKQNKTVFVSIDTNVAGVAGHKCEWKLGIIA